MLGSRGKQKNRKLLGLHYFFSDESLTKRRKLYIKFTFSSNFKWIQKIDQKLVKYNITYERENAKDWIGGYNRRSSWKNWRKDLNKRRTHLEIRRIAKDNFREQKDGKKKGREGPRLE